MEISDLLNIASEIRVAVQAYLAETPDHGMVLKIRERDVTRKIDLFAERALENALLSRGLCARIISEELGDRVYPEGGEPAFTLIFDPIDGSTNAALGIPLFCTSLAYAPTVEHVTFSEITASVVATIYGKTYYAVKGGHAWVDGTRLPATMTGKTKRVFSIYTYGADSIPEAVLGFQKGAKDMVIRVLGSIALELCLVAEGAIDAVVDIRDLINGYDIAGAALILHEAGGVLTNLQGEEFATEVGNAHNLSLIAALEHTMHARMHALVNSR